MARFPLGVQGRISRPTTYTLQYMNGLFTYTERFALITCSKEYVDKAGAGLRLAVSQLAAYAAQIPYIGPALAGIVEHGALWYGYSSLNRDGSLTLQFAYHYCGTKAGGMDITALGVDPKWWANTVRGLMRGIESLWLDRLPGDMEDDLGASLEIRADASPGRAVLMGTQADMQRSLGELGIPEGSINELLNVGGSAVEETEWWYCVEVDAGEGDPQGECDLGMRKKGMWRHMQSEGTDGNGIVIWSRKISWCSGS